MIILGFIYLTYKKFVKQQKFKVYLLKNKNILILFNLYRRYQGQPLLLKLEVRKWTENFLAEEIRGAKGETKNSKLSG